MPLQNARGYVTTATVEQGRAMLRETADRFPALRDSIAATLSYSAEQYVLISGCPQRKMKEIADKFGDSFSQLPDQPGTYNVCIPLAEPMDTDSLADLARSLGLLVWSPVFARPANAPLRPGSTIRILDKAAIADFARNDEVLRNYLSKHPEERNRVLQTLSATPEGYYGLLCAGLSQTQRDALVKSYPDSTYSYQLSSGDHEVWIYSPFCVHADPAGDPYLLMYVQELASNLGMEVAAAKSTIHPRFEIAESALRRRITAEDALNVKATLAQDIDRRLPEVLQQARWPGSSSTLDYSLRNLPIALEDADIVLWQADMWEAALSGCEIFHTMEEEFVLATKNEFWCWEQRGYSIEAILTPDMKPEAADSLAGVLILAVMLEKPSLIGSVGSAESEKAVSFALIFNAEQKSDVPIVRLYPPVAAGALIPSYLRPWVAAAAFMRQPLVGKEEVRPPHHIRRRAEREKKKLSKVHVIYLRRLRPKTDKKGRENGQQVEERTYGCQWLVGGHWREQPYPSKGITKRIYIAPYFKGPISAPFKPPGSKIYKVAR